MKKSNIRIIVQSKLRMRKIRVSELPLWTSLKGFYVLGVNAVNQSVRLSLDFIKEQVDTALLTAERTSSVAEKASTAAANAANRADAATDAAQKAASTLMSATETLTSLIPVSMTISAPVTITLGSKTRQSIKVNLKPDGVAKNVIYMSDNRAVKVNPHGGITAIEKGIGEIHVIPVLNTSLAQTITVKVSEPTLRLENKHSLRLTSSGDILLN